MGRPDPERDRDSDFLKTRQNVGTVWRKEHTLFTRHCAFPRVWPNFSFIQQVFLEHLLCACTLTRSWRRNIYVIYVCTYMSPFLCWFSVHFIITASFSSQWACLIAAGPKGQKHTETQIVSWSITAVLEPWLKPGKISDTGENVALSGLLGKDFLLAWSSWLSLSFWFQASNCFWISEKSQPYPYCLHFGFHGYQMNCIFMIAQVAVK